jgi:hypothetical protein
MISSSFVELGDVAIEGRDGGVGGGCDTGFDVEKLAGGLEEKTATGFEENKGAGGFEGSAYAAAGFVLEIGGAGAASEGETLDVNLAVTTVLNDGLAGAL